MSVYDRKSLFAASISVGVSFPNAGWTFNENGFFSGMALDEVSRLVEARGTRIEPRGQLDVKGRQEFLEVSGPRGNYKFFGSLAFCRGKLTFYSITLPENFPTFLRLAEQRTVDLGPAQYFAQTIETRVGSSYEFRLAWSGPGWTEWLDIAQLNNQTVDVAHSLRVDQTECD